MKVLRPWVLFGTLCAFVLVGLPREVPPSEAAGRCSEYSDSFDTFNPERWQEVLLFSKARATVRVVDGSLCMETPPEDSSEAQVYSLFTFKGDFDIQVDYELVGGEDLKACRFNAAMVLQTLGDEMSYKFNISASGKDHFLFRARRDLFGEQNQEMFKMPCEALKGSLRARREGARITFLAREGGDWRKVYTFEGPCEERMRLRFKLQTSDREESGKLCPVAIKFTKFTVLSCEAIQDE